MPDSNKIVVTIPLSYIAAVSLFSGKNDVRYYLNGLALDAGHVVATNGHFMGAIPVKHNLDNIVIPGEAVKTFLKMFTAKEKRLDSGVIVDLILDSDEPGTNGSLSYSHKSVGFETIDARYPEWERIIPSDYEAAPYGLFNWDYMAIYSKAARFLGCKIGRADLKTNGKNGGSLVKLSGYEAFIGVIMPMRF